MHFATAIPQYPPHTPYPSLPLDPHPPALYDALACPQGCISCKQMLLVIVDMYFVEFVLFSVLLYIFEQKVTFLGPLSSIIGTLSARRGEEKETVPKIS